MTAPAMEKLNAFGIDAVCAAIADGESMTSTANRIGVSFGSLNTWLENNPEYSARVRESRRQVAKFWDEEATRLIEGASDPFELAKAKEISYHLRWRASKIAPKEYGDKVTQEHTGANGAALPPVVVQFVKADKADGEDSDTGRV